VVSGGGAVGCSGCSSGDAMADKNGASAQPAANDGKGKDVRAQTEAMRQFFSNTLSACAKQKVSILKIFDVAATLGTGTFGRVRLVCLKSEHDEDRLKYGVSRFFALKMMKKTEVIRLKQVEHIKNEKAILYKINHPFIVVMYLAFQDPMNLYMVLEFIVGGELFTHLRRMNKFSNDHTRHYAGQIQLALQYLHQLTIAYRDLKPENLLLDREGNIKITDFGFAKEIDGRTWTLCGTPEYLAPEIIQSKGHGHLVDWWALGILIYEMLAGFPPFYDENPFGIYQRILQNKLELPRHFETHARDLIRKLLTADLSKRYGSSGGDEIKKHKWFRGLSFADLETKAIKAPFLPEVAGEDDTAQFDEYPDSDTLPQPLDPEVDTQHFSEF